MSTSAAAIGSSSPALASSHAGYNSPAFWGQLWRTSGLQFVGLFIVTALIYGYQPQIGASPEASSCCDSAPEFQNTM